jgi:preprotein translocase subunit YajC
MRLSSVLGFSALNLALLNLSSVAFGQEAASGPVQTTGAAQPGGAPGWINLVLIGGMVLFMWLFIIRPQSKRQKEHRKFLDGLKVGQEVVTQGGLIGKITSVADAVVMVDFGSGPVKVLKSAVATDISGAASFESNTAK